MEEKSLIYGLSNYGLLFMLESRAHELADGFKALLTAKTWGEFKSLVSKDIYQFYLNNSIHSHGPNLPEDGDFTPHDIPAETIFTPNDVVKDDIWPSDPESEMSEWMPDEIQEKYGRKMDYFAMDMNVPGGYALVLEEKQMDKIVVELEKAGFSCKRDEDLLMAATTLEFEPDDYPAIDEDEDEGDDGDHEDDES